MLSNVGKPVGFRPVLAYGPRPYLALFIVYTMFPMMLQANQGSTAKANLCVRAGLL